MLGVVILCFLHLAQIAQMFRFPKNGCCVAIKPKPKPICMVQPGFAIRMMMKEIKESEMRELIAQHEILLNRTGTCCFAEPKGEVIPMVEPSPKLATVVYDPRAPIIGEDEEDYGEVPWFDL